MQLSHHPKADVQYIKQTEMNFKKYCLKKLLALPLLILSSITLYSQNDTIDSLRLLIAKEKTDTGKIETLITMGSRFGWGQPKNDSAFFYLQQALQLSQQVNYISGEIYASQGMTNYLRYTGNYSEALRLALQNLKLTEQHRKSDALFFQTRLTGWIYADIGDFNEQLKYAKRLAFLAQSHDDKQTVAYYNAIANNCISRAYSDLNLQDSALYYERAVYMYALKSKAPGLLSLATTAIGDIFSNTHRDDSALIYYKNGIYYAKNAGRTDHEAHAYLGLARLFLKGALSDSALFYTHQTLRLLQNTDAPKDLMDAYSLLSELYRNTYQYDSALSYMERFVTMKDSLYNRTKIAQAQNLSFNETLQQQQLEQEKREIRQQYQNKIKLYSLGGVLLILLIIASLLYKNNRNKQKANAILNRQKEEIQTTLSELKSTQSQLIQSEKMASLGELTAGIAHEIQNPLNFVNNFSEVSSELIAEMRSQLDEGSIEEAKAIADDVKQNLEKINHHGKRADAIVKSMLQHSRTSTGKKQSTDINTLTDEYLRLSYHGMRAKDKSFNCEMTIEFDESLQKINVIPQDIGRVLLNLFNNAFYACAERSRSVSEGQANKLTAPGGYIPTVTVTTRKENNNILIAVKDNGSGIPEKIKDKVFQPFFTTKPAGSGTGLGLSLSYDIITKEHNGMIKVESAPGEGTTFIVSLPG